MCWRSQFFNGWLAAPVPYKIISVTGEELFLIQWTENITWELFYSTMETLFGRTTPITYLFKWYFHLPLSAYRNEIFVGRVFISLLLFFLIMSILLAIESCDLIKSCDIYGIAFVLSNLPWLILFRVHWMCFSCKFYITWNCVWPKYIEGYA